MMRLPSSPCDTLANAAPSLASRLSKPSESWSSSKVTSRDSALMTHLKALSPLPLAAVTSLRMADLQALYCWGLGRADTLTESASLTLLPDLTASMALRRSSAASPPPGGGEGGGEGLRQGAPPPPLLSSSDVDGESSPPSGPVPRPAPSPSPGDPAAGAGAVGAVPPPLFAFGPGAPAVEEEVGGWRADAA